MNKFVCLVFALFLFTSCSKINVIDEPKIDEPQKEEPAPQNVDDWKDGGKDTITMHPD